MASKKKVRADLEEDNRHLNQQLCQLNDEMKHLRDELKTVSQQKSATLIELQQLQKETKDLAIQLKETKEKEHVASKQAEDAEKQLERASAQFKEKIHTLEQECSRFQIEMSKLQLKVDKQDSVILEKQEEARVKDEAIQHLEQRLSRIKVDCGTRTSNIESALVQTKKKCTALAREVDTMSAEKMSLLSGYEQLKSDYEKVSSPQACSTKEQVKSTKEHVPCRSAVSDTHLLTTASSPSSIPVVGQLTVDRDISAVMSDYRKLQQDHHCLLVNFQQTTLKLEQLKKNIKEKDSELASLQSICNRTERHAKQLEEKMCQTQKENNVETVVANPESIREALEAKTQIHNLERDLEEAKKKYHMKNSELLEKQASIDHLNKQMEMKDANIANLQSELQFSSEQIQTLKDALENKECGTCEESLLKVQKLQQQLDEMTRDKYAMEDLLESAEQDFDQLKVRATYVCI
jgi:chromosome segregation ATPase